MTDEERSGDAAQETQTGETRSGMGQEISSTVAKLGAGEKLAVLGAAGVLAVWFVFDLLIDEYSTGPAAFLLALVVSVAAYRHHNGGSDEWAIPYRTIVSVGASLLGILGAWFLIEEVRGDIFDTDAATVIGGLAFYVAAIVSGVGAYQLSSKR